MKPSVFLCVRAAAEWDDGDSNNQTGGEAHEIQDLIILGLRCAMTLIRPVSKTQQFQEAGEGPQELRQGTLK